MYVDILALIHCPDRLAKLSMAEATFRHVRKDECVGNTHSLLRATIMTHLREKNSRFVFLKGGPGTSKTAISKSIAIQLSKEERLAASFFFDKSGSRAGANTIAAFVSTLAFQLAQALPEYKLRLHKIISSMPDVLQLPLEEQLKLMIIEQMNTITTLPSDYHIVIVLDGLDECGNSSDLSTLMRLVIELDKLPSCIVVLVSSRPEQEVMRAWERSQHSPVTLDTNDDFKETERAIFEYTSHYIAELAGETTDGWQPTSEELEELAGQCQGIFGIASLRVLRLREDSHRYLPDVFDEMLDEGRERKPTYETEYLGVLRRALRGKDGSYTKSKAEIERYRKVMGLLLSGNPLALGSVALLIREDESRVRHLLGRLSSVTEIVDYEMEEDDTELTRWSYSDRINFRHATFKEFLLGTPVGTGEEKRAFFFTENGVKSFAPECCFRYMRKESVFGSTRLMHDVVSAYVPCLPSSKPSISITASDIQTTSTAPSILEHAAATIIAQSNDAGALWDACYWWSNSLYSEEASPEAWGALSAFMIRDVLRWIEFWVATQHHDTYGFHVPLTIVKVSLS